MLEKITYKNHLNETIDFGEGGLYLNNNELHSFKWEYGTKNNRISYFQREVKEMSVPVVIVPPTNRAEGTTLVNAIMEISDKDVIAKTPGRIMIGDYYLDCYIVGNEKNSYDIGRGVFYSTLSVVTDKPAWIKETSQTFDTTGGSSGQNLDFPFDFPYDFTSPSLSKELVNYGFADSDFKMTIYGEATNPAVTIGGHSYSVTGHVDDNEYLEIDSREKTVTLVQQNGTRVNWFSHRNKVNYIFQKIPSGSSHVLWSGDFVFDITLFEERSEPKWT